MNEKHVRGWRVRWLSPSPSDQPASGERVGRRRKHRKEREWEQQEKRSPKPHTGQAVTAGAVEVELGNNNNKKGYSTSTAWTPEWFQITHTRHFFLQIFFSHFHCCLFLTFLQLKYVIRSYYKRCFWPPGNKRFLSVVEKSLQWYFNVCDPLERSIFLH